MNLTARIARAARPLDAVTVVEIGPGPGGLTRALLAEPVCKVIAVERDTRCEPALEEVGRRYPGRLHVEWADALAVDLADLVARRAAPGTTARIVANLPYNVGTVLLSQWLQTAQWPPWFDRLTLMFQREVAERIVATVDDRKNYGRLGVLCGWRTQARILFDVPPSAFVPAPKVTSSVVELRPRAAPLPCRADLLAAVAQAAFGQRRKMLRQSLNSLNASTRQPIDPKRLLTVAGIDPTARAEEIDISGFAGLARAYEELLRS